MLSDMPSFVKKNTESVTLNFTQYNRSSRLWVYPNGLYYGSHRYDYQFSLYQHLYKDGGSSVRYKIQIEGEKKEKIANTTYTHDKLMTDLEITVYGLQPYTWYNLSVVALFNIDNRYYPSRPSNPLLVQTCAGMI